ncbi:MAG TPA: hypothetical protein VGK23_08330 [Methanomassiliicoccales archaeon]|jgi:hypothetical protein
MKRISLNSRSLGSEFAGFERELMRPDRHAGWVKFIAEGVIRLRRSPFSEHYSDSYYYVPEDIHLHEGELVDLNVGPLRWAGIKIEDGSVFPSFKASYRDVRSYEKGVLRLPRPRIDAKDFQYFLTEQWRNAEYDDLGKSLALQLLSCPSDVYGNGGIGAQSICLSTKKGPLLDLKSTIRNNLPVEFTGKSDRYRFDVIEREEQTGELQENLGQTSARETSFNFLTVMNPIADPLPVQVPTTIINAHKVGVEKEQNLDVLEYLLYSLMLHPVIKRSSVNEIEAGMRLVKEQVEPESVELDLPIDRYAITKLAMALCRLEGREEIDDSSFSKSRDVFFDLYREFLDTKKDQFGPGKSSFGRKGVRSQVSGQLDANDLILLSYVRKISRQQGKEYVTVQDLKDELGKKRYQRFDLDRSLERLNVFGRVLRSENMSAFKPIDLD